MSKMKDYTLDHPNEVITGTVKPKENPYEVKTTNTNSYGNSYIGADTLGRKRLPTDYDEWGEY